MKISGTTQIVGLIGWPVSHSVSPAMHNAAFDALGLDWRYIPLPVEASRPGEVRRAVLGLRALGMKGANVTVPHKAAVMPHLDRLSAAARAMGAVNLISVQADGTLHGDNADAPGFIADLRDHGVDPGNVHALVLGAGGSARAVVYGLANAGAASITIVNRTLSRAEALVEHLQSHCQACRLEARLFPDDLAGVANRADLVVNCTSLGMTPHVEGLPWDPDLPFRSDQVVYDLVYNPPRTRLLQKAEEEGAQAIGGLGMLIWQGAIAFERWTGQAAPVAVMRAAALDAFER